MTVSQPGPMAVNTVAYVGYRLRGGLGALVCATAVLLPTVVFMVVLAELYFRFGTLPEIERIFSGILPAVAAIILSVCLTMGKKNLKSRGQWGAFLLVVVLLLISPRALKVYMTFGVVFLYGLVGYLMYRMKRSEMLPSSGSPDVLEGRLGQSDRVLSKPRLVGFVLLGLVLLLGLLPLPVAQDGLVSLMTTFSSMSLTLFGGGYVFIPMIQDVVVDRFGWLTSKEFIDGIALGQVTPGPILISAAFIGQKVAGIPGALLSTAAIFAPPAVLMVLLTGMLDSIKASRAVQSVGWIQVSVTASFSSGPLASEPSAASS